MLIWHLRLVDFADLLITAPFYVWLLLSLHEHLHSARAPAYVRRAFLILSITFLYGHAMHVTANAIHTYGTEVQGYARIIPVDLLALIHFLDETLSHIIIFISLYGLFVCLLIFESRHQLQEHHAQQAAGSLILGTAYGFFQGLASIEAQKVALVISLSIVLLLSGIYLFRSSKQSFKAYIFSGAVRPFLVTWIPVQLLLFVIYSQILGDFIEPSQLFGSVARTDPWPM